MQLVGQFVFSETFIRFLPAWPMELCASKDSQSSCERDVICCTRGGDLDNGRCAKRSSAQVFLLLESLLTVLPATHVSCRHTCTHPSLRGGLHWDTCRHSLQCSRGTFLAELLRLRLKLRGRSRNPAMLDFSPSENGLPPPGSAILRPARTRGPSGGQREKNGSKRSASEGGEAYGLDRRCVESALC